MSHIPYIIMDGKIYVPPVEGVHGGQGTAVKPLHKPFMKHQTISFIKSGIRLIGYVLIPFSLEGAALTLFMSELIGIVEEIGHE